ncbi:MAG: glutamate ligase domain-containing protein, partial [Anaerolineales bacterium]
IEDSTCDIRAESLCVNLGGGMDFQLIFQGGEGQERHAVTLQVPGRHNVLNALGAFGAANCLGLDRAAVASALAEFKGSERRFDIRGEWAGVMLVDDYGHHPTEIAATLAAARAAYPERYIRAVWQPHTYSRTTTLIENFAAAFGDADQVIVLSVYEAREKQPAGFSIEELVSRIDHANTLYLPGNDRAAEYLEAELKDGDLLLVFSAGDAIEINDRIEQVLSSRSS